MKIDTYIHTLVLSACLVALTGCATAEISPIAKTVVQTSAMDDKQAQNSVVLMQLASMKSGDRVNVGGMTIDAGETYTAASGSLCRHVMVSGGQDVAGGRRRVVCNNGQNWFFSEDVFLTGSSRD